MTMANGSQISYRLDGRRALVTGSASGIGLATAELLARSGANVVMNDVSIENLAAAVTRLRDTGLSVEAAPGDLGRSAIAGEVAERALRESQGAAVNTVSVSAFGGGASSTAYATAKAGLVGLTRELARGLAPNVRVNGIAPGLVNSPWECSFGDLDAKAQASVPLARVGEPRDYAEVIVFLCAGAGYVTGEVIPVTGGSRI